MVRYFYRVAGQTKLFIAEVFYALTGQQVASPQRRGFFSLAVRTNPDAPTPRRRVTCHQPNTHSIRRHLIINTQHDGFASSARLFSIRLQCFELFRLIIDNFGIRRFPPTITDTVAFLSPFSFGFHDSESGSIYTRNYAATPPL
jgi:hypothetical protein